VSIGRFLLLLRYSAPCVYASPTRFPALEKNFTSGSFQSEGDGTRPEDTLSDPGTRRPNDREAEVDRLLHRRKGLSGSEFAGVGIQFAATIVVFALAGVWLDKRLGTSPWLLIGLVLGGSGLGFWSLYRKVIPKGGKGR
jgi:F0F1-type ATP synthase assembly protein I